MFPSLQFVAETPLSVLCQTTQGIMLELQEILDHCRKQVYPTEISNLTKFGREFARVYQKEYDSLVITEMLGRVKNYPLSKATARTV